MLKPQTFLGKIHIIIMKKLLDKLVKKHWKQYEKDFIGAGFPDNVEREIRKEIDEFLSPLAGHYDHDEYQGDTDEYVKFIARLDILEMVSKEIEKHGSSRYPTPKRFQHHIGPRD